MRRVGGDRSGLRGRRGEIDRNKVRLVGDGDGGEGGVGREEGSERRGDGRKRRR